MQTPTFNYSNWDVVGGAHSASRHTRPFIDKHTALIAASVITQFNCI